MTDELLAVEAKIDELKETFQKFAVTLPSLTLNSDGKISQGSLKALGTLERIQKKFSEFTALVSSEYSKRFKEITDNIDKKHEVSPGTLSINVTHGTRNSPKYKEILEYYTPIIDLALKIELYKVEVFIENMKALVKDVIPIINKRKKYITNTKKVEIL